MLARQLSVLVWSIGCSSKFTWWSSDGLMNHAADSMATPESNDTSSSLSLREHGDECWEARVIVRIRQELRFRSPWSWSSYDVCRRLEEIGSDV